MQKISLLLLILLFAIVCQSSNPAAWFIKCPSLDGNEQWPYLLLENSDTYRIRLRINNVNNVNINYNDIDDLIDRLNDQFYDMNINFEWDCTIYDVDNWKFNSENAIDINFSTLNIGGQTTDGNSPSTGLHFNIDLIDGGVPAHELGHCFGLLHTHHNHKNETWNEVNRTCEELMNQESNLNGLTCGDCIATTLATDAPSNDEMQYDSETGQCLYIGQDTTSEGDIYTPDLDNFMSYARTDEFDCRSVFVPEQGNRMRNIIEESRFLDEVRIYDNFSQIDLSAHDLSKGINFGNDIFIHSPLLLPDGAEITMFGNHGIYIEPGGFIEGNNITFQSACGEEWKGIKIRGQQVQDVNTGIRLTGNSIIKNAKDGISQQYGNDFNGYMNLNGTTFLDCERGIELMSSNNDQSIINSCNFINGKYGITAWQNNFTATSCTFTDIYERGIYGLASSPHVSNDANVVGPHFQDCNIGILLAFPSGQTSQTTIENNYFLQNNNAIVLESSAGVSNDSRSIISQNRFDINWVAVNVSGASSYELSNNEFNISFYGNYIDAAGPDPNEIFLNHYNDALVGPLFTVDNSRTNVERNCFSNHTFFDMFVDGNFADQGTDEIENGNCFSLTNSEIGTSDVGPGFIYFQLQENTSTIDDCIFVESEGNFTILDSNGSKLFDNCGTISHTTPNGYNQGHSPCNPNRNESDIEEANEYIRSLIEEIENSTLLDEDQKENLIKYYERCLRKNTLLLASILIEEGRIDDAVYLFNNEEEFDMKIKGYSILVDQNRLTESEIYLDRLITSSEEEQDFIFAQGLYLNALLKETYQPTNIDLNHLHDNGHKNTVLAGFSRSVYLFFTDELIEIPIDFEEISNVDPRNPQQDGDNQNEQNITIYPNPFQGNTISVDYKFGPNTESSYILTSLEGKKVATGLLQSGTNQIEIQSQITGLLFLQITDEIGNVEIHKLIKTR